MSRFTAPVRRGRSPRLVAQLLAAALLLCLGGCVSLADTPEAKTPAGSRYRDGVRYLRTGAYLEAQEAFQAVLAMPGFSAVTPLARLRLGDALFQQRKLQEAMQVYRSYVQRHDGSPNVPYAEFMIAWAHFREVPTESTIMPPAYEMDLSTAERARYHLERFVQRYPLSPYVARAMEMRDRCIALQLRRNDYVVRFYVERERWIGVVFRLHRALTEHAAWSHNPENYALLVQAYTRLGWRSRAISLWRVIAERWPDTVQAGNADAAIAGLRKQIAAAEARGEAGGMPAELPPLALERPEQTGIKSLDDS